MARGKPDDRIFVRCSFCGLAHPRSSAFCDVTGRRLPPAGQISRASDPRAAAVAAPAPERPVRLSERTGDDALVGQVLADRFRILRVLGTGGSAVVFACNDLLHRREVALKIPRVERKADKVAIHRFFQEASVLQQIRHPSLCNVFDAGLLPDGHPFIVLELLKGRSLHALIASRGPLALGDAVHVGAQLLSALDAIHAKNLVHRDVKPANVFVVAGGDGTMLAKLLDFGLAKDLDSRSPRLTPTGKIVGTPAYLAPEQIESPRAVDVRVDVYGMGILLFEAMAGKPPFRRRNLPDLFKEIRGGVPPLRTYVAKVPSLIEDVVRIATNRDPSERFPTVRAMKDALVTAGKLLGLRPGRADSSYLGDSAEIPALVSSSAETT